jgi:hypothetical protein
MAKKFVFAGVEFEPGDIVECLKVPVDHAERHHIVLQNGETRDLGNNNADMWVFWTPLVNIGHYRKHPDIFDQEDKEYYFPEE